MNRPPRSESESGFRTYEYDKVGQEEPFKVSEGVHSSKRKRTVVFPEDGLRSQSYEDSCGERFNGDADCERYPSIRDSSFDSELSWFQEHYGQVWNAVVCESDAVASSSGSR